MSRRQVAPSAAAAVVALLLGLVAPAAAVVTNFGMDFTGGGSATSPTYTTPPVGAYGTFYGGEAVGFTLSNTVDTTVLQFAIDTGALPTGATVTNFELFFDGSGMTPESPSKKDTFNINLCDGNATTSCTGSASWTQLDGANKEFDSGNVPLARPAFGSHTGGGSNTANLFMSGATAFFDEIQNGYLLVQIVRKKAAVGDDSINGVNLQVAYDAAPVPEPTSMLLFGTMLAGLGQPEAFLSVGASVPRLVG